MNLSNTLKTVSVQLSAAIVFLIGVPGLLIQFGVVPGNYFKSLGTIGIMGLVLLAYAYAVTYVLLRKVIQTSSGPNLGEICKISRLLESERRHHEVVALGVNLSRYLWVNGRWRDRIEMGIIVWRAGGVIQAFREQLMAAVDMVGWTSEVIGKTKQAEDYLKAAISLAREKDYPYFLAKAHRHLGGVHYRHKEFEEAKRELEHAEKAHEGISDEKLRMEMLAGIYFGRAEIHLGLKDFEKAINLNSQARKIYDDIDDESRKSKCITQEGRILLARSKSEDLLHVHSILTKALGLAEKYSRSEQLAEAHEGLGDYYCLQKEHSKAKAHFVRSKNIRLSMGFTYESTDIGKLETKIMECKNEL